MDREHWLETYKSLIALSIEAFKFSALINGGAVVALLAYMGNVAGKGAAVPDMRWPMAAFLVGLLCCGFAIGGAYLTQLGLLNELSNRLPSRHPRLLWATIFLVIASFIAFGIGAGLAVVRFA